MESDIKISQQKRELLDYTGNMLVLGGPGSGKTTIALLKANQIVMSNNLNNYQFILFLSFARSTIARVQEHANSIISRDIIKRLEINTYHGFCWDILRSYGNLLTKNIPLKILTPPEAASRFADISNDNDRNIKKLKVFQEEGYIHFDLFAKLTEELLSRSKVLLKIICNTYPIIIFDEFQDTNKDEWNLVKILGQRSKIIALADINQRIYEFRGADPKRISEYITEFEPKKFDFELENHRSKGTDIVDFGNDLITGVNKKKLYKDISIIHYPFRRGNGVHLDLKFELINACKRLKNFSNNESLGVLVPTKSLMLEVSRFLVSKQRLSNGTYLPEIPHDVALETAGPSLAAVLIAGLLESDEEEIIKSRFINDLCEHIRGRNGEKLINKSQLEFSNALRKYNSSKVIRGKNRLKCIEECLSIIQECKEITFSGNPIDDWMKIRNLLIKCQSEQIKQVALDAQFLRILGKTTQFRSSLGSLWVRNGNYNGARNLVKQALLEEHFSISKKSQRGIYVMTMHKAKGKEFDEVLIYEGRFNSRIANSNNFEQSRLNLRVSVTRAMKKCSIITPQDKPCEFL